MKRSKLSQALFGSAMALAVSSSAHARPMLLEPRDDVTFSMRVGKAVPGLSVSSPGRLDLSGTAVTHGGGPLFGGKAPLTNGSAPFDATSFGNGDAVVFAWDAKPQADSNQHAHGREPVGKVVVTEEPSNGLYGSYAGAMTFEGLGEHGVSPVAPVPEPSTYALLAMGLAGIAVLARRRR